MTSIYIKHQRALVGFHHIYHIQSNQILRLADQKHPYIQMTSDGITSIAINITYFLFSFVLSATAMTSPQQLEVGLELKCNIEKVWECMKNATTVLPEAFPHKFDSFEVLEGDGIHAGTVYNVKFKPGHPISSSKDKIELVDEEKKIYVKRIVDGDFMKYFKEFKITIVLSPKGDHETSLKWGCEFVKASEDVPIKADNIMADAVNTIQVLEAYILKKT